MRGGRVIRHNVLDHQHSSRRKRGEKVSIGSVTWRRGVTGAKCCIKFNDSKERLLDFTVSISYSALCGNIFSGIQKTELSKKWGEEVETFKQ